MKQMWTWLAFALAVVIAAWAYFGLMTLLLLLEGWERAVRPRSGSDQVSGESG